MNDLSDTKGAVNSLAKLSLGPSDDGVRFDDRQDAGRRLATLLERFRDEHPIVLGIPRGGIPVAAEVARALASPLDIVVVRKMGAPECPEYGIGALAEGGVSIVDETALDACDIGTDELTTLLARAHDEFNERIERYRGSRAPQSLEGRTVLLVDDGLATGHSARAAAQSVRQRGAARVVLAVPVAAPSSLRELLASVDEVVSLQAPADMRAIGCWYKDFQPPTDEKVAMLLEEHDATE